MTTTAQQTPAQVGVSVSELDTVLAAIERETHDAFEMAQSFCQSCIEKSDRQRWRFGDVTAALKDNARYGDSAVNEIARISRVGKSTAHLYAQMAKFYTVDIRDRWQGSQIGWSSMKYAMRLKNVEDAVNFLDEAAREGWTADQVRDRTKGKPITTGVILECAAWIPSALMAGSVAKGKETSMLHLEIPATADVSQVIWFLQQQKASGKKKKVSIRITAEVLPDERAG